MFAFSVQRRDPRFDVLAVHFYGWRAGSCTATRLDRFLDWAESLPGNQPIAITELGCGHDSGGQSYAFMRDLPEVFAEHPRVVRWAWFPTSSGATQLARADGSLTRLARLYRSLP